MGTIRTEGAYGTQESERGMTFKPNQRVKFKDGSTGTVLRIAEKLIVVLFDDLMAYPVLPEHLEVME